MKHFPPSARVAELADALDLGSSPERDRGSNPLSRTIKIQFRLLIFFRTGCNRYAKPIFSRE
jgi:hypothetical protein